MTLDSRDTDAASSRRSGWPATGARDGLSGLVPVNTRWDVRIAWAGRSAMPTHHAARAAIVNVATNHEVYMRRSGDHEASLTERTRCPQLEISCNEMMVHSVDSVSVGVGLICGDPAAHINLSV